MWKIVLYQSSSVVVSFICINSKYPTSSIAKPSGIRRLKCKFPSSANFSAAGTIELAPKGLHGIGKKRSRTSTERRETNLPLEERRISRKRKRRISNGERRREQCKISFNLIRGDYGKKGESRVIRGRVTRVCHGNMVPSPSAEILN